MKPSGITIQLYVKTQVGFDGFNNPIYEESIKDVENVLIAPVSAEDIVNEANLSGKKVVYELAIPKGNADDWTEAKVSFFGQTWKTVGVPTEGLEHLIPLSWNKKIKVERYE